VNLYPVEPRHFNIFVLCVLLLGCESSSNKASQESSAIKPLALLYGQFTGQHRGTPPKDEAEFKAFVEKTDAVFLKSFAIDNPDLIFVSSRDHKPYVIVYGTPTGPPGPGGQPVIAYEQIGVSGKRYVASFLGAVEEVDEARFRELVPFAP